jgi:hypothetical protein
MKKKIYLYLGTTETADRQEPFHRELSAQLKGEYDIMLAPIADDGNPRTWSPSIACDGIVVVPLWPPQSGLQLNVEHIQDPVTRKYGPGNVLLYAFPRCPWVTVRTGPRHMSVRSYDTAPDEPEKILIGDVASMIRRTFVESVIPEPAVLD